MPLSCYVTYAVNTQREMHFLENMCKICQRSASDKNCNREERVTVIRTFQIKESHLDIV